MAVFDSQAAPIAHDYTEDATHGKALAGLDFALRLWTLGSSVQLTPVGHG